MSDKLNRIYYRDSNKESVEELTTLAAQFRNAYFLKDLEAQMATKQANCLAQEASERLLVKSLTLQQEKIREEEIEKSYALSKSREEYKSILEEQIQLKLLEKLDKKEMEKTERAALVEVDRILDEEYVNAKIVKRDQLTETLRRERLIFEEIREINQAREIDLGMLASENQRKHLEEMNERSLSTKKIQDEERKKREKLIETVAELFLDNERKKQERQSLIYDLISETMREEPVDAEHESKCRTQKMKAQLGAELKEQMMFLVDSEARSYERDRVFVDDVMARIMEDEKISVLTYQTRRRKQMSYKKDLEDLIEERRRRRNAEIIALKVEQEELMLNDALHRQMISDERKRLIHEHFDQVSQYLRKGALSREEHEDLWKKQ